VLNAGTNILSAVFTPTDTVDYLNSTDTVLLVVSPAPLTITSGVIADGKVYDGTASAKLSFNHVAFAGILNGDSVSLNTNDYAANFESAGPGHAIAVTVNGLTLSGASAGNYTLAQPGNLAADITAPSVQIAANSPNIVISWTTNAAVFVLKQTGSLKAPLAWSPVTNTITVNGTNNTVVINPNDGAQYFALIAAP